ncbi:MAG: LmeA family phospholipid-binding protein [Acidimicrobiales bacterium]
MRLLVLAVVVVAVVLAAGEVVVPPRIEDVIAERVAQRVPEAASVDAELDGFPVVARGLATGEVGGLVVTLDRVARPEVTIDSVRIKARGIKVARRALVDGEVDLEHIDRGRLDAVITEAEVQAALPDAIDLDLSPGRAEIGVAGQTVGSDVTVTDGVLRFELGPLPDLSVPLPGQDFFPCPLDAEVVEAEVHLSCVLEQVPDYLLRRLEEATAATTPSSRERP